MIPRFRDSALAPWSSVISRPVASHARSVKSRNVPSRLRSAVTVLETAARARLSSGTHAERMVPHPSLPLVAGLDSDRRAVRVWDYSEGQLREVGIVGVGSAPYGKAIGWNRIRRIPGLAWHPDESLLLVASENGSAGPGNGDRRCYPVRPVLAADPGGHEHLQAADLEIPGASPGPDKPDTARLPVSAGQTAQDAHRRRQVDDHARDPRARPADLGDGDRRRAQLPGQGVAALRGRRPAGRARRAPRPFGLRPPAQPRRGQTGDGGQQFRNCCPRERPMRGWCGRAGPDHCRQRDRAS